MIEFLLLGALALVAPYVVFGLSRWGAITAEVIYQGEATVSLVGLLTPTYSVDYSFYQLFFPEGGTVVEAPTSRIRSLDHNCEGKVKITIKKSTFDGSRICAIRWPGEEVAEETGRGYVGLYLGATYMILALLAICVVASAPWAQMLGRSAMDLPAVLLALSGWVAGFYLVKPVPADGRSRLLYPFLWGAMSICLGVTGVSLWCGGVLLLIGSITSFAFGQLLAMLAKSAHCAVSAERAQ